MKTKQGTQELISLLERRLDFSLNEGRHNHTRQLLQMDNMPNTYERIVLITPNSQHDFRKSQLNTNDDEQVLESKIEDPLIEQYDIFTGNNTRRESLRPFLIQDKSKCTFILSSDNRVIPIRQIGLGNYDALKFMDDKPDQFSQVRTNEISEGYAFGALEGNNYIATTFGTPYRNSNIVEIQVATSKQFRKQGLAKGIVAVITDEIFSRNKTPLYMVDPNNIGSIKIPPALGCFDYFGRMSFYRNPHNSHYW